MAIFTNFYAATDDEIRFAFGWLPEVRVRREVIPPTPAINPFTKEPLVDAKTGAPVMQGRKVHYEFGTPADPAWTAEHTKRRNELPHVDWKDVSSVEIGQLCFVLLGDGDWEERIELVLAAPDFDLGETVCRLPEALTSALATLPDERVASVGREWMQRLGWNGAADEPIRDLRQLARAAVARNGFIFLNQ